MATETTAIGAAFAFLSTILFGMNRVTHLSWLVGTNARRRPAVGRKILKKQNLARARPLKNRGGRIRTDDFLLPKQALYQAELRPA